MFHWILKVPPLKFWTCVTQNQDKQCLFLPTKLLVERKTQLTNRLGWQSDRMACIFRRASVLLDRFYQNELMNVLYFMNNSAHFFFCSKTVWYSYYFDPNIFTMLWRESNYLILIRHLHVISEWHKPLWGDFKSSVLK